MPPGRSFSSEAGPPADPATIETTLRRLLSTWENSTHTLNYLLHREFHSGGFTSQERAILTDRASTWARGRGAARYLLDRQLKKGLESIPTDLRLTLEITVSRLLFEERTPKAILVSEAVTRVRARYGQPFGGLTNALLRALTTEPLPWPDPEKDKVRYLAAAYSHPEWLVQRWLDRWGEERTKAQLAWDNSRPSLWLRWNCLRGDIALANKKLQEHSLEYDQLEAFPGYFRLRSSFFPQGQALVEKGDFQVQDPSASLAVQLLNPQPGMRILDLCAAPGGKGTLLAQRTDNGAEIIAVDRSADRLKGLQETLETAGITCVRPIVAEAQTFALDPGWKNYFDAVLLDVPCSGFGVLARRADLRWRRQPEDLRQLTNLQQELLEAASDLVRPGGTLVYSTCSIEPDENEAMVNHFLGQHSQFDLGEGAISNFSSFSIRPGEVATNSPTDGVDGIYAAELIKRYS